VGVSANWSALPSTFGQQMADFTALMDFMEDDGFDSPPMPSKTYPEGHVYRIPSPDAETGLRLSAVADLSMKQSKGFELSEGDVKRLRLNDQEEREFIAQVLSPEVIDLMVADGVKWEHLKRLGIYAFTFFGVSREAADKAVEAGLFTGKELAPNRAQRRSKPAAKSARPASAGSKKASKKKE